MRHTLLLLLLSALLILVGPAGISPLVSADWTGRFELGGTPVFYDDTSLEDRTPLTTGLRLSYSDGDAGDWLIRSSIKLRTEANSPDGNILRIKDLFIRYGQFPDRSPMQVTAGVFNPEGVSGAGDVIGAGVRFNLNAGLSSRIGLGVFGGGNSVVREGATRIDGIRYGAYVLGSGDDWGQFSLAYVSTASTDLKADEADSLAFSTTVHIGERFDFFQTGEYILKSGSGNDNTLASWTAEAGIDLSEMVRLSVTADYYDQQPSLAASAEDSGTDPDGENYTYTAAYSGSSIGPRLDVWFGQSWRVFGRYRYRQTDDYLEQTWNQLLAGFGFVDPSGSGVTVDGSFFVNRGDTRDYETGFIRIGRDFGPHMNLSLNLAADRFARPETAASAPNVQSTWRTGLSGFYRISSGMTAILTYERTFADDDRNSDHRVMFNWQYRF